MPNRTLLTLLIALTLAVSSPAAAQTGAHPAATPPAVSAVIARIEAEGFAVLDTRKSWLGRLVITSTRDRVLREVVLNRTTGAILSDRLFAAPQPTGSVADPDAADGRTAPDPASQGTQGSTGSNANGAH